MSCQHEVVVRVQHDGRVGRAAASVPLVRWLCQDCGHQFRPEKPAGRFKSWRAVRRFRRELSRATLERV